MLEEDNWAPLPLPSLTIEPLCRACDPFGLTITYHFVIYLVEMNFTNFVYHIFTLKCNEAKTCKDKTKNKVTIIERNVTKIIKVIFGKFYFA